MRDQPIDNRMIPAVQAPQQLSYRELLVNIGAEIGALKSSVNFGHEARKMIDDKLDILADKVEELGRIVASGIGDGRLQDRDLHELQDIIKGDVQRGSQGLVRRVDELERQQARAKNLGMGIGLGAGVGGTALGASINAIGKKLGLWAILFAIGQRLG